MGFIAQPDGTFRLYIAGGLGNNHRMGVLAVESLPASDVLYAIRAMIDVFCAHGNYENRAKSRTRYLQETLGAEELCRLFNEALAARKAEGGLDLDLTPAAVTKTGEGSLTDARAIPQKQAGLYAVVYHPIGGILPTDKPAELAALLGDMPAAECRVAPNETLYVINLTADEARRVLAATADGAKTVFETSVACIGASICQQGVRDSQGALHALRGGRAGGRHPRRCPAQDLHLGLPLQLLRPSGRGHRLPGLRQAGAGQHPRPRLPDVPGRQRRPGRREIRRRAGCGL